VSDPPVGSLPLTLDRSVFTSIWSNVSDSFFVSPEK
jgi:hypothetical protein